MIEQQACNAGDDRLLTISGTLHWFTHSFQFFPTNKLLTALMTVRAVLLQSSLTVVSRTASGRVGRQLLQQLLMMTSNHLAARQPGHFPCMDAFQLPHLCQGCRNGFL